MSDVWTPAVRPGDWTPGPGHDYQCEWGRTINVDLGWGAEEIMVSNEECRCAVRAYQRDPFPGALEEPWPGGMEDDEFC